MSSIVEEAGLIARRRGADLYAQDRAALDAQCEDARCRVCAGEPQRCEACVHPNWLPSEDTEGGLE